MQVQFTNNCSFGRKNSFLQKSKNALLEYKKIPYNTKHPFAIAKKASLLEESNYYKSLRLEAMARLEEIHYQKAKDELQQIGKIKNIKDLWLTLKLTLKKGFTKFDSLSTLSDAYSVFPERFNSPDNPNNFPIRNYKY